MWWTANGERVLEGAEARVFAEALLALVDEAYVGHFDDYDLGVNAFDKLTYGQKVAVLAIVGNGLLRRDVPRVDLTADLEGAIAAVFEHLKNMITIEIDMPELGTNWRDLVVAARREAEGEEIPPPTCNDLGEWEIEVESLANDILWDADYDDADLYLDQPPEKAEWLKSMTRIPDNYYLAIADDLNEEEIAERLTDLRRLCRAIAEAS
jgi:hypothetical protein